ncbi:tail fiber domain-containing protein [Escherichia coli]|uniref:tail fiber domain-containing protein n=1 Tax=Escherichia coli TaxID=562 RepID=UPI00203FDA53|nr:tail fiber domain-containing protein [Escherichia coli]
MIYTIGNIAVSGNTLTGTGTNFKAPLSMIRVGCTVIVKSDPIQIFSITEIVSETELSVTPAASPDIPAGTAYSILLCDSISVDGLAQDVAEALRYFTGQESEIYAAVEYWKNYGDAAQVEALLTAIQAETAQSTANAAATAADVETTAAALNEAVAAKDAAEAAAANAEQQAATATTQATTATEQATAAAEAAEEAKQHRATAYTWMSNAEAAATTATEQATTATEKATAATDAATAAQEALTLTQEARDTATQQATIATEQATIATDAANAAETSAANVAADEQEIAANAAAAAEAATAAALSEANAKTYAEQAKTLSEDSLSLIGLGASPRHCSDLTGNPSAYIGFLRLTQAGTTGYPDVASDEGALSGYICRNDDEPSYSGLFVGATTGSAYTYRYSVGGGVQWQRIPRANDLSRFVQNNSTTRMYGPTGDRFFEINTIGNWGVYSTTDSAWVPLAIAQGGTGATDAATARTNLGLGATNDVQHQNLTLTRTSDGTSGWVAGGMTKSKLLGADGTVRAEGLVYAECNASSPTQITFSIYSPSEGQKYLSFNTKGQILAETAIFRSTYVNPLIIESVNPTVRFNETDRPSGAPYYSFIADGGNWRIQKEGDGYSGEYIISYEYANDRIVIPNLKVEYLYAPADKVQQIKNNLLIPNTGLSRWYDYAAPEGAEADKFYPIIISHPSGWSGDTFVEVSMRTRPLMDNEEPNCNAIHLWMRDSGWSDMGQGCFGHYCAHASNEVAILCVRGTGKGQYPHNAIYVRGDAFPVRLAATVGSTITIPTADWSPSTTSDSPTYKWGITDSADGLDFDTYGVEDNLLDFTHGKSGFYSDRQFRHANGDGYLYNHMTVGALNITSTEAFNFRGTSNFYGTVNCGYGYYSVSDDVTKCTYYSRLIDSSGNILGQGEFRVGEYAAQIVVRDLTDTAAHKFFNFNKDGTFHAPNGCVTHTGADWSGHTSDNINKFKPIAGSTNGPSDPTVFGGFHVSFSGNYATQFAGRLSQFWARSIEAGVDQGWRRLLTTDDLSASTDLTVNSLTTTTAVRSGGGDLHILGDTAYREAMNCGLTGYDSTGQNMGWYLGTYKSQEYKVYFEDYLGSEGIELNGDNGSVKLYTGGLATGTPAELTLYDNQCLSTVNYTIKPASSSWDRYFTMENSGTAYHNGTYQFWGNAVYDGKSNITGDRYSVFEWKLDTGSLAYLERSADGSQKLQVDGGIHCTAVTQSSDRDLKDNIEVIPDATAAIRKMNGYTYTLKENGLPYAGIIAQEAMEAIPEAVGSFMWEGEELEGPTQDGRELRETARYLNVDYAAVTGLLVQVARETDDRVTALEEENASLRANIAVMDERITKLEALVQQLTGSEE